MKQPIVFIVDDEPTNLGVLFEHAQRVSWRVLIHTSGASALKTIPTVMPDIILLDIIMPEMDGFEVCERLKANPATRGIPIIFVTALTFAAHQIDATRGERVLAKGGSGSRNMRGSSSHGSRFTSR